MDLWHEGELIGLDYETTGVDTETALGVSCSIVRDRPGAESQSWDWLINPGVEIPAEAAEVHGITTERARAEGMDAATAAAEIADVLGGLLSTGAPLVVYNAPYDLTLHDRECRRHGVASLLDGDRFPVLDPLVMDKAANRYVKGKGQRQLTPTCARYGIKLTEAHDAAADVAASILLTRAIAKRYREIRDASLDALQAWQRQWHSDQQLSLASYFQRTAGTLEGDERLELETKAASCASEAGLWPFRPVKIAA